MLKSNGSHHPKIQLKKFGFSPKTVSANIAKKLPPQRCSKPFLIPIFNFSHKRPTFAFTPESGYTLGFTQRLAHSGPHGETRAFRTGPLSLPSERSARSPTSPGRVSERQVLLLLGLGRGCSKERRKPSEQRCAYARRCSEGVAAPLGCAERHRPLSGLFLLRYLPESNSVCGVRRSLSPPLSPEHDLYTE